MNLTTALPTFIITLREGVEAALVVGIVLALLEKAKQSRLNPWVYAGVGVGIIVSATVGFLLNWVTQAISAANPEYASVTKELLEGIFSIAAIVMLSWMLIWMTKQARFMKAQVEGAVLATLTENNNAGWGVFSLVLIAVVREGFETVFFVASNFQQGIVPALGALAGLVGAVIIGVLLFKVGVKINIRLFFQVMGVFLLLIVSGLVMTALHKFDAAALAYSHSGHLTEGICFYSQNFAQPGFEDCILGPMVTDTSKILPDRQFPGIILKSLFGYRQNIYLLQAVAYIVFLVTVGGLYFRSLGGQSRVKGQESRV